MTQQELEKYLWGAATALPTQTQYSADHSYASVTMFVVQPSGCFCSKGDDKTA
ncbi:MAG: hypothetical protein GXY61_15285 [Lentisphaerae bacterium]|jgi:hypothetical protein|nr:hypothetical protein [Lentisphaerota bacterium]